MTFRQSGQFLSRRLKVDFSSLLGIHDQYFHTYVSAADLRTDVDNILFCADDSRVDTHGRVTARIADRPFGRWILGKFWRSIAPRHGPLLKRRE